MKPEGALKHFFLALLLAVLGYVLFYYGIEHWRTRKGPWRVTFTTTAQAPAILIAQPSLGVTNVQVRFAADSLASSNLTGTPAPEHLQATSPATNSPALPITLTFGQLRPLPYEVPFGKCIFLDTTSLPGTVVLELLGHEIELLPRTLVIDRQEHAWRPGLNLRLPPSPAPPDATRPPR